MKNNTRDKVGQKTTIKATKQSERRLELSKTFEAMGVEGKLQKTDTSKTRQEEGKAAKLDAIKVGIDVHKHKYVVVMQEDGASPKPAQCFMTQENLLKWMDKQKQRAREVWSCYEAGPLGYSLHRELEAMGIKSVVMKPVNLDEACKGVKTDAVDALAIVQRLDRYAGGNSKALAIIQVPTKEQEIARAGSRFRQQWIEHRKRHQQQGSSLLLAQGIETNCGWWKPTNWERLKAPEWILKILKIHKEFIEQYERQIDELAESLEASVELDCPKGVGKLSMALLSRELKDWHYFHNRRQIASITGMCPSVEASGKNVKMGHITKHGNPRIRHMLIEMAWRIVHFQPQYPPVKRWEDAFKGCSSAQKKKAIVAIGRHLIIDLWRINTNKSTPEQLGLAMSS
jgi:transposase